MTPAHHILVGDCLELLRAMPDESVHCCITSPPYFGLRDYGMAGQIGLEPTPAEFVARLVEVFREVRRVLRDDGTLWVNMGDSYASGGRGGGGSFMAVRVERLQDISLQQARAEGCEVREFWLFGADAEERQRIGARAFERLWTSINGVESWAANPWVWVVEFKRVTP